ncbi:unnamed protein product, partial [Ixodes pacificus]
LVPPRRQLQKNKAPLQYPAKTSKRRRRHGPRKSDQQNQGVTAQRWRPLQHENQHGGYSLPATVQHGGYSSLATSNKGYLTSCSNEQQMHSPLNLLIFLSRFTTYSHFSESI